MITRRELLGLSALALTPGLERGGIPSRRSRFGAGTVRTGKREHTGVLTIGSDELVVARPQRERRLELARVDEIVVPRRGSDEARGERDERDERLAALAARLLADPRSADDLEAWIALVRRGYLPRTPLGPPIRGRFWIVPDPTRHHALHAASVLALDLAALDDDGLVHAGTGRNNEDYAGWDRELVAVADGRVLRARDDRPDDRAWQGVADPERANDLVLELDGGLAFYQHLRQGSLEVRAGRSVKRGEVVARLGNAGNATWPHLHFALYETFGQEGRSGSISVPITLDACRITGCRERVDGEFEALDVRCENVPLQESWVVAAT